MRLKSKRYFKFGSKWISSREFKILNVPEDINKECIETAIRHIMHGQPFYVHHGRTLNNDVTFTLKNDHACNTLKNVWAININDNIFQLTPGFFQKSHLEYRNQYIRKFQGLTPKNNAANMMDILLTCDARYAYSKHNNDRYIYVQFANEQDLFEACTRTFYKGSSKITGLPKDTLWTNRQAFLSEHKYCRYESPAIIAKSGLKSSSESTRDKVQKWTHPPIDCSSAPRTMTNTQKDKGKNSAPYYPKQNNKGKSTMNKDK